MRCAGLNSLNCSRLWIQSSSTWLIDGRRQEHLGQLNQLAGMKRLNVLHQHWSDTGSCVRNKANQSVEASLDFDAIEFGENCVPHRDAELPHLGSSAQDEKPSLSLDVCLPNGVWR